MKEMTKRKMAPQMCRLTVENLVIGERRITDLPVSCDEAMESCVEIGRAERFADGTNPKYTDDPEDEPLGCCIIRRPGEVLIRWYCTNGDLPAAEARFVLMLQGEYPSEGSAI